MRISLGILARNEADRIAEALRSVFVQTLFAADRSPASFELVVVANGCSDATARIARATMSSLVGSGRPNVRWRVYDIATAGKANAWNQFVHELSDPLSDYLFLMDGDIRLLDPQTLASMVGTLETTPRAWVTVDRPIKDVTFKARKRLRERLSLAIAQLSGGYSAAASGPAWICGQLYCARADMLRRFWLPIDLLVDDGFLYHMVVTNGLAEKPDPYRVLLAPSASHVFEPHVSPGNLLRHEMRQIVGGTINAIVYEELTRDRPGNGSIGQRIDCKNRGQPDWLASAIRTAIQRRGWWLIPAEIMRRRFRSLQALPYDRIALFLPLALAAFVVDSTLALVANLQLRYGRPLGRTAQAIDTQAAGSPT